MQPQNLFVFDIETIPDLNAARNLLNARDASDDELRQSLIEYHLKITDGKNSFLRQPFFKVICIGFVEAEIIRQNNGEEFFRLVDIRCGGDFLSSEADLIRGFFRHLQKKVARLVSFNGRTFDLPVLKYGAMKHEIEAAWLYKAGDKWSNYNHRYGFDWHCDLADAFSDFGASARIKLNELCSAFNLPGKLGVDGSQVLEMFLNNELESIRNYCETDAINTYLLYLIFCHHCGRLNAESFQQSKQDLKDFLAKNSDSKPHFAEFLSAWEAFKSIK